MTTYINEMLYISESGFKRFLENPKIKNNYIKSNNALDVYRDSETHKIIAYKDLEFERHYVNKLLYNKYC